MPDATVQQRSKAAPALPGSARAISSASAPLEPGQPARREQQRSGVKGKQRRQKGGGFVFSE